jgi:hypothetical protein
MDKSNTKIKFTDLLTEEEQQVCLINAPIHLLEGLESVQAIKNAKLISSEMQSDFYRSASGMASDFYKPVSKI